MLFSDKNVVKIDETPILADQIPVMLFDGELFMNTSAGKLTSTILKSHLNSPNVEFKDQFKILINLRKYSAAWELCKILNLSEYWDELGNAAISDLEVSFGKNLCFRCDIEIL